MYRLTKISAVFVLAMVPVIAFASNDSGTGAAQEKLSQWIVWLASWWPL